ncbi:MAG: glycosyltransferase, partial [Planctomycetota bacterium]
PFETESYEAEINALIDCLEVESMIERVGFTQDVTGELAKLDAMVLPSLFGEGLPMVVLEAMAAAVPVIATRVEGTPEAVTDGVEGLLAQPNDPESLATRIRELVSGGHDWKTLSEAAFTRHARDFSDFAMAEKTAAVYRHLLA